jgi:hypothetical protein
MDDQVKAMLMQGLQPVYDQDETDCRANCPFLESYGSEFGEINCLLFGRGDWYEPPCKTQELPTCE